MKKNKRNNQSSNQNTVGTSADEEQIKKKKLRLVQPVAEVETVGNDSVFDAYRLPHEVEDHWELRRLFMEKNDALPADELECLAQVFMNIELLRCRYPAETMKLVAELSEGITTEYRRRRATMLNRTFVSASNAAASKVQRKRLVISEVGNTETKPDPFEPVMFPRTLKEMLRNIIVMNNQFDETVHAFNRLNSSYDISQSSSSACSGEVVAYVKAGEFILAQVTGTVYNKALQKEARMAAMEYLGKHCYSLLTKKKPTQIDGVTVVTKTFCENNNATEAPADMPTEISTLSNNNVGFKLMKKLGWNGGCLGMRGEGIIEPVTAEMKKGRRGLGHEQDIESNPACSYDGIEEQLQALWDGVVQHHLVFSTEFTKNDRSIIHRMANKLQLKTKSFGSEKDKTRQLVVYAPDSLTAHMKLKKVLIEKDPFYCEMFEVKCPTEKI